MIDLAAQGPVYRGHKLARIVDQWGTWFDRGGIDVYPVQPSVPLSTKAWARLDVRVIGNPWGLSVSDLPRYWDGTRYVPYMK